MTKPLKLWTGRLDYVSTTRQLVLNTTIGSGKGLGAIFAPTWPIVNGFKSGRMNWNEYSAFYIQLMRNRYKESKPDFERVCRAEDVVLCCYCPCTEDLHCHRFLLATILLKTAASLDIEADYFGETSNREVPML